MYWRWSITTARYSGSRCRFSSPPVRLTFGRQISNDLLPSSCSPLFPRRFPYDRQNCSMKFGTWTYDSSKVNLKFYRDIQKFDLHSYVKSNEWSIIGNSASRNTEKYGRDSARERASIRVGLSFVTRLLSRDLCRFEISHQSRTTRWLLQLYSNLTLCTSILSDLHSILAAGKMAVRRETRPCLRSFPLAGESLETRAR